MVRTKNPTGFEWFLSDSNWEYNTCLKRRHASKACPNFIPGATYAGATYASKVSQGTENVNLNEEELEEIHKAVNLFVEKVREEGETNIQNKPETRPKTKRTQKHKGMMGKFQLQTWTETKS
ncbi:hypothetical protein CHS0354_030777 [Potamilus streckersoni]|uniref:Uncharacterized protein n=1 Tax=Potamilus streckersoni TaxID=2493646 RepID=A0AAE0WBB4_9BIVA|nr:hypothetical protein CHS0354_030777 [Potamilus streckersoni]